MAWRGYGGSGGQSSLWQQALPRQVAPRRPPGLAGDAASASSTAKPRVLQGFTPAGGKAAIETYTVYTTGDDADEVVVRTLMGEYVEQGSNHGRKVYKKPAGPEEDTVEVVLYYWDERDGPQFCGWWFGNMLGGTQVWSHCSERSMQPPKTGWKIPWDGEFRPSLVVENMEEQRIATSDAHFKEALAQLNPILAEARLVIEQAKSLCGDFGTVDGLHEAEQILQPQAMLCTEAMKQATEMQKAVAGEPHGMQQFSELKNEIKFLQTTISTELAKIKLSKNKADKEEKDRVLAEKDLAVFQDILPEATQKTNAAEDAVEKAIITQEMIAAAGDDMDEAKHAVTETETAVQDAQKAIGEARIFLNAKQASFRRFKSASVVEQATAELGKMQAQLQEIQNRLNPLKTARQEFNQRAAAKKLALEVLDHLTPAEVDVDKAEEATVLLGGEGLSKEMLEQAEQAVTKAGDHVNKALKFIEQKKKPAAGPAREELMKMEERAKGSQQRLAQLKDSHKDAAERVSCLALLKEAADKVATVHDAVQKATDAEAPFLMGVEDMAVDETLAAVKVCETAATSANTSVSIARMFLATKMVEARRFSPGPSAEATAKLKEYQQQLDANIKKLNDFKSSTAKRKHTSLVREAQYEVTKVEALVKKVTETASIFDDDTKLFAMSAKEIRAAAEETANAEAEANAALAEAKQLITDRQIEAKGKDVATEMGAELSKFQARLTSAESDISKYKKLSSTVEQRLAAKRIIEDGSKKLQTAEEKITRVLELLDSFDAGSRCDKGVDVAAGNAAEGKSLKEIEEAAAAARTLLKAASRYVENQSRSPGMAKDEVLKMQPVIEKAEQKLETAYLAMRERSDRIAIKGIVDQAAKQVDQAEEAVNSVAEREAPFLKGADLAVDEASKALTALDDAVQGAQTIVSGAKTFLAMKRLAAKRLSESAAKESTDEIGKLQARLDELVKKLGDSKKSLVDRKLAIIKLEVSAKVSDAEKMVEAAVSATQALPSAGMDIAPDIMKSSCEKAGAAQHEAQDGISSARTVLLNRQRDAKTSSADSNTLSEISKMLDKLTKMQQELEKQKGLLRDQEQRFVAGRLSKDANNKVEELEKKLENTTEVAAPLVSDKKEDFTAAIFLTHIVAVLKDHLTKNSKTADKLFDEIAENKEHFSEERFTSFIQALPELKDQSEILFSDEQLSSAFHRIDSADTSQVTRNAFLDQFRNRYICTSVVSITDSMNVKGGKTIRKLEVNEMVEALEEPKQDGAVGLQRVKVKAEKDDKEGFVTLSGNQGTVFLESFSPYAACQKRIERALQELGDATKEVSKYIEQKCDEMKSVRSGPLFDTRSELQKLRPRVSKVQYDHSQLKKSVAAAQKKHSECMEIERQKRLDATEKKAASAVNNEATENVKSLQVQVDKLLPNVEKIAQSTTSDQEDGMQKMDQAEKDLELLSDSIEESLANVKSKMDGLKSAKGPWADVRTSLIKLKVRLGQFEAMCKKILKTLRGARKKVETEAHDLVVEALRAHVKENNITPRHLFEELSKEASQIDLESLRQFTMSLPNADLKPGQLELGLRRYKMGLSKLVVLEMLQEYHRCVKEIAITTAFAVKDGKTLRKLGVGELLEVLEPEKTDPVVGLTRVRCRAVLDNKDGWVTVRGNQGTSFLEKSTKPYFCCQEPTSLQSAFESGSSDVGEIEKGEVMEILEGPRKEPPVEIERMRGRAANDGKSGWVTLKDP